MFVISIDLGYRYVKAVNSNWEKIMFPSFASTAVSRDLEGFLSKPSLQRGVDINKLHVTLNEYGDTNSYFVGNMAVRTKRPIIPFGENKINNVVTKVLVATATGILTKGSEGPLHVTSGLPLMQFPSQQDELYGFLEGLNLTVEFPHADGTRTHRRVRFDKVTLYPQGASAVYYVAVKQDNVLDRDGALVGLIDIGGKTTEALMFRVIDGDIEGELDRCDTFDLGTSLVEERVRAYFQGEHGRRLESNELHDILKTGRFFYKGRDVDMEGVINKARRELAESIKEELNHLWGKTQDTAYLVLWAGGGASDIMPYVASNNAMLIRNAQFANALGNLVLIAIKSGSTWLSRVI